VRTGFRGYGGGKEMTMKCMVRSVFRDWFTGRRHLTADELEEELG
jgi:hypothetical protein